MNTYLLFNLKINTSQRFYAQALKEKCSGGPFIFKLDHLYVMCVRKVGFIGGSVQFYGFSAKNTLFTAYW